MPRARNCSNRSARSSAGWHLRVEQRHGQLKRSAYHAGVGYLSYYLCQLLRNRLRGQCNRYGDHCQIIVSTSVTARTRNTTMMTATRKSSSRSTTTERGFSSSPRENGGGGPSCAAGWWKGRRQRRYENSLLHGDVRTPSAATTKLHVRGPLHHPALAAQAPGGSPPPLSRWRMKPIPPRSIKIAANKVAAHGTTRRRDTYQGDERSRQISRFHFTRRLQFERLRFRTHWRAS